MIWQLFYSLRGTGTCPCVLENPTEPTEQVKEICEKVGINPMPYKMKKSVGVQISERKNEGKENQGVIEPDTSNTG